MKDRRGSISSLKVAGMAGKYDVRGIQCVPSGLHKHEGGSFWTSGVLKKLCESSFQDHLKNVVSAGHPEDLSPKKFLRIVQQPLWTLVLEDVVEATARVQSIQGRHD